MTQKTVLISGITGQDGSFLAEQLLEKGYKVFGLVRRCSTNNVSRIEHIKDKITLIPSDMGDQKSLVTAIQIAQPDEAYNLAAQSFVAISWGQPEYTMDANAMGCLRFLEAIRFVKPDTRFYQASSSEMFGQVCETPQKETTKFHPRSPYGISKVASYWLTVNYRESYNMFTCNGILYNHESHRRGIEFVTRKITNGVAKIALGRQQYITLGNLDAKRDWGYAPDYCEAMHLMLQQKKPDDYIIATGRERTIRDFLAVAFDVIGVRNWHDYIKIDEKLMRPAEVVSLCGDSSKAKNILGWQPKTSFEEMVKIMVQEDMRLLGS